MKDLNGRVAVVTGAANGIGLGLATRFLEDGMRVVLADQNVVDLRRAERELGSRGEVLAVETDVADRNSVQALADAAVDCFGAVHLLCNNAGVGGFQRFDTTSLSTWDWTLGVNLFGVIYGCHIFLPILSAQDEAYIINTASMSGFLTGPYLQPYAVSKAGAVALSESLAAEFAVEHPNVRVAVLCPAYTSTAIHDDERGAPPGHIPRAVADSRLQELRDTVNASIAAGISPTAVADLVVKAMAAGRTHIFPHPDWLNRWQDRVDTVKTQTRPFEGENA
ncbi:SDR family NAD(P)-dependent oxidoreductase [Mycolicibacterium setense]|uniref:SDR family NAD(P)-dependent oxidoreductase n=1 Tax=Mycolicibacterium setense TaxID=431269 RepID=UPI0005754C6C|nr:SDR family NAD(P)-dependent oxidoreductase [Mycolicibacterium setense]KHO24931.1 short-chain dehydrogenase [Mycolicibacterium setense]MCV7109810.1 SDR family NAD(P)-dependent oxidoreductase [Mycolicibacterium setense]